MGPRHKNASQNLSDTAEPDMKRCFVGPFEIVPELLVLLREGRPLPLGPKVVETLLALVERYGLLASNDELLERIWPEGFVSEANLAQNIYVLRKTFREHGIEGAIENFPGRGYRLLLRPREPGRRVLSAILISLAAAMAAAIALTFGARVGLDAIGAQHSARPLLSAQGESAYRIGRYYWDQRTREGVRRSLVYFQRVIDSDATDARGYAAMADANVAMGDYCYGVHQPEVYFARAQAYAQLAIRLQPSASEAHASLAYIALHERRLPYALRELRTAIALDAGDAPAREWYGIALLISGDLERGTAQLKYAARLDPLSVSTIAWLAQAAHAAHRETEALRYAQMVLELSPGRTDALRVLAEVYLARGQTARAIDALQEVERLDPYLRVRVAPTLASAYARAGNAARARAERALASDVKAAHPSWASVEDASHNLTSS